MEVLAFVLIVFTGSWVIAARARERGQSPANCVLLLVGLSTFGAVSFGALAIIVGCGLWGFDVEGDGPPPWEKYFLSAAVLIGTLSGMAAAVLIARRADPRRVRERRAAEADYDEPEPPGPAPPA